jgi:ribosomal protein S18 acetylase RimI-like enzyme
MAEVALRAARPAEAEELSALALRSKAHWGYDESFLEACRAELTYLPDELAGRRTMVAELAGRVVGFYTLDGKPPVGELGNLWVDPASMGNGLGRLLWSHAVDSARAGKFRSFWLVADPHAEGFYLAMGAIRLGETPSDSVPGRMLPMMLFVVS